MKKQFKPLTTILFLLLSVILADLLNAGLHVKAGPMLSKMDIDDYGGYNGPPPKSLPGFRAGISYPIRLLKNSSLEPGISFTNEAVKYYEYFLKDYSGTRVNFLKCNLLLNLHMAPSQFHITAGPYLALRAGKEKNTTNSLERFISENKTGLGLLIGLRFYFKKSRDNNSGLFLEILGDIGLTKFQNRLDDSSEADYKSKNISLMLGYGLQ